MTHIMDADMLDWDDPPSMSQLKQKGIEEGQEPEDMEDVEPTTVASTSPSTSGQYSTETPSGTISSPSPNDDEIPTLCIPPKQTAFDSFEKLSKHLSQSNLILDSFKELYERPEVLRTELSSLKPTRTLEAAMTFGEFSLQDARFATEQDLKNMDYFGACMLMATFRHARDKAYSMLDKKSNELSEDELENQKINWVEEWRNAVSGLRGYSAEERYVEALETVVQTHRNEFKDAFDAQYLDPHNAVDSYIDEIRNAMENYLATPQKFIAPYTSILASSMLGKSRLIKQISFKIPTIYICVRNVNDGYPNWSPECVRNYVLGKEIYQSSPKEPHTNELRAEVHMYAFYHALFVHLIRFFSNRDGTPNQRLQDLWYTLAEEAKPDYKHCLKSEAGNDESLWKPTQFWERVISEAMEGRTDSYYSESKKDALKRLIAKAWKTLSPYLEALVYPDSSTSSPNINMGKSVPSGNSDKPKPLLLMVWDEARSLVDTGLNGEKANHREVTKFRINRRITHQIVFRWAKSSNPIRLFTLVTDTASRIINFQPSKDSESDSARLVGDFSEGPAHFNPIYILPTFDYQAEKTITLELENVDDPQRLITFGRSAWNLTAQARSADPKQPFDPTFSSIVDLASLKLLRSKEPGEIFDPKRTDDLPLKMLALLGPRLSLQSGSYGTHAGELVASHLMVLFKVSKDHKRLESYYPSEPILAEASAEATAKYGWQRPLEILLSAIRHGVVEKGFRGEFITRIMLLIACEDALRSRAATPGKWPYAQRITVAHFLKYFLRATPPVPRKSRKGRRRKRKTRDWDSDEEEEPFVSQYEEPSFREPPLENDWTTDVILNQMYPRPTSRDPAKQVEIERLLNGHVFFNHFISLKAELRPSLLIQAFNKGAALMARENNPGFDFILPVLLPGSENKLRELGPLFGAWTEEQEESADEIVSYVVIQTKDQKNYSRTNAIEDLHDVVPRIASRPSNQASNQAGVTQKTPKKGGKRRGKMGGKQKETAPQTAPQTAPPSDQGPKHVSNFECHTPRNYFISIVQSLGSHMDVITDNDGVTIYPQFTDRENYHVNYHDKQIPIIALGISDNTYECLVGRENITSLLQQLRHANLNPLRGKPTNPVRKELIREYIRIEIAKDRP